jgi:ABC-2 type transport system permease protein
MVPVANVGPSPAGRWGLSWRAGLMLAKREWLRFFRQRNRVIAAVVQPLLFWLLFGTGLRGAFAGVQGQGFLEYFLPGTVALILLFTAIFATISVIEDRREGFLQGVLVAPVSRWSVLVGKVLGGGAIAWVQAVLFLGLIWLFGQAPLSLSMLPLLLLLFLMAAGMVALGMVIAWPMDSTQGFHAVMNLVLMPLWLLSGSFFPIPIASPSMTWGQATLAWAMKLNPLSYGMAELRRLLYPAVDYSAAGWVPDRGVCWVVSFLWLIIMLGLAAWLMRRPTHVDAAV